jgi:hypothetical protein
MNFAKAGHPMMPLYGRAMFATSKNDVLIVVVGFRAECDRQLDLTPWLSRSRVHPART